MTIYHLHFLSSLAAIVFDFITYSSTPPHFNGDFLKQQQRIKLPQQT
ncbi:hypothetical protein HMPREF1581_01275 [Gardnerella vaginalis JCP8108]|uniref:Uncharacterized protein n=1 Tax=Gardnerella vaginalis JCP8108 TaxID=1261066 RepID=S4HYT0_GARVA|nr:hypothetical protein HMPREF1581_01275 [Gardnerella vaginalis JCP8108]